MTGSVPKSKLQEIREEWYNPYGFQSMSKAQEYIHELENELKRVEKKHKKYKEKFHGW